MSDPQAVGYGKPPQSSRFKKGRSGNPKGRPKSRRRKVPYDTVLGQMVTIREDGRERRVTAAEAFLLQLTQKGLAGDSAAARASLDAIEVARNARVQHEHGPKTIAWTIVESGVDSILGTLGIAQRKYPTDGARMRWHLNPWIIERALDRLGEGTLTTEEQREVWHATRTPHKVQWPAWWRYRG
ncbi:MAG: DUF5681 domain-containing protein [Pseudomonadota bacterium]